MYSTLFIIIIRVVCYYGMSKFCSCWQSDKLYKLYHPVYAIKCTLIVVCVHAIFFHPCDGCILYGTLVSCTYYVELA